MRYDVTLKIVYNYETRANGGRNLLRMMPKEIADRQRVIASSYLIAPEPVEIQYSQDFFGTSCAELLLSGSHSKIEFGIKARVERTMPDYAFANAAPFSAMPKILGDLRDLGNASPLHFLAPSTRITLHKAVSNYARAHVQHHSNVADIVRHVGEALHHDMTFDAQATDVDTPLIEAFNARHGVCQDFSHIMISALRGLGIPAGYVSGYLRTTPPKGKQLLEGADAMHAWVIAWCGPELGWIEYDPTNGILVQNDHIIIGYGRDYADLSPVIGLTKTVGGQSSRQSVTVRPLDCPPL